MSAKAILSRIARAVTRPFRNVAADVRAFSRKNESEAAVLASHVFSAYRGTFVLRLPMRGNAASFGIIFLGNRVRSADTVRHEYGHRLQLRSMGLFRYIARVAVPSVRANLLDRRHRLPFAYYDSAWEAEADRLGGVVGRKCDKVACRSLRELREMRRAVKLGMRTEKKTK